MFIFPKSLRLYDLPHRLTTYTGLALRRLAEQEEARALLEAQLKRERRREWYKQHETVLLGVGLPVAMVGTTAALILVIHLLTH